MIQLILSLFMGREDYIRKTHTELLTSLDPAEMVPRSQEVNPQLEFTLQTVCYWISRPQVCEKVLWKTNCLWPLL